MTKLAAYTGEEIAAESDPFAKVRELGFERIEIAGVVLPLPEHKAGLADWSERLARLRLEPRFHCSPETNSNFYNANDTARSVSLRETAHDIERARQLGIRSVVVHPSTASNSDDRQRVIESLHVLQEQADVSGVQLELECASGPFNGDPRELVTLCEAVPGMGIAIDVSHAFRSSFCLDGTGDLTDWISIAAPWVKSIQFNDVKHEGNRFIQSAVGQGDVPYEDVMPKLLAIDCLWWTIELASIRQVVESKRYLERFLDEK